MTANKNLTNHELFWLASYAHNTLAPLYAELKTIEPSIQNAVKIEFADAESCYFKNNFISVDCHWGRDGMFLQESHLTTKADIDKLASKVKDKITALKDMQEISALLESATV